MSRQLIRRPQSGMVAGVCAGLANYFGWDVNNVRIFYVLLSIISAAFPGLLVYILLWIFMPASRRS
ncbi:MAG: PspC domain-containing protein [Saprospiraceae bacterium]|nr:PspC domain-containing protein [Saprospiraceae bacterium]